MNSLAKTLACGSGLLALVIAASMSGCSSSDSNGGSGGTGGTPSGGSAGTSSAGSSAAGTKNGAAGESDGGRGGTGGSLGSAGADTTGTAGADTTGMAGDTGAAGAGAEGAVAKFCNQVTFGTEADPMDTTFRLDIGTAPNVVSFSAVTGTCVPMTGACKSIPLGPTVPYNLIDTADGSVVDFGTIAVADGKGYLFLVGVDGTVAPPAVFLDGGSLTAAAPMCSDIQYSDLP